jgi:hypothetical protein
MSEDTIHQPNDKLLKATFSVPENARAFFANHLPHTLAAAIDWASLALDPCSFVHTQLASSESDLLFSIKLHQKDALIYLLFEHQSTEDPRMALRLLSYILRIWERFAKEKPPPARLPAVLPIVLAQGRRPWKTAPRLEDLIDLPPGCAELLRPWQPALAYHLLELARIPYGELAGTPEGILTLRALKAEPVDELLDDALWDESLWFSISEGALERLLRYIFNAEPQVPKLRERIRKIQTKPLKHKAMTLADQLRAEGKLEGKQEGLTEGRLRALREAVQRALEIRHGSLPDGVREAVEAVNDRLLLERLHEGAIKSASIEDFARLL